MTSIQFELASCTPRTTLSNYGKDTLHIDHFIIGRRLKKSFQAILLGIEIMGFGYQSFRQSSMTKQKK